MADNQPSNNAGFPADKSGPKPCGMVAQIRRGKIALQETVVFLHTGRSLALIA
ncbi:MAG: hypothetical protein LC793_19150 [Thermomicrobia bacterium]|nr:hypothetical protein [Thermomicrobia bacterium]